MAKTLNNLFKIEILWNMGGCENKGTLDKIFAWGHQTFKFCDIHEYFLEEENSGNILTYYD